MAKTCFNCGTIIEDNTSVYCPNCGKALGNNGYSSGMLTAAYILMILTCVAAGVAGILTLGIGLITLAWLIPMTVHIHKREKSNEPLSVGFKICTLIFCNVIAGILLLCDSKA